MTFAQWRTQYQHMAAIAHRLDESGRRRANDYARLAGLGEGRNVWHNALLDYRNGRPWEGVDYAMLRRAKREDDLRFRGSRIVKSWSRRVWPSVK